MHGGLIHHPQHAASPAKGNPHDRQQIHQSLASKSSQGAAASTLTGFFQPAPPPERHPAAELSGVNYHDVMTSLQAGMMRTTIQDQHHPTSSMLPGTPPPPPRRVSHSSSIASSTPFVAEGTSGQRTSRHGSPAPPPPPGSRMTPVTAGAQRVRNKTPLTARRNAPRQPTCRASLDVLNRQLVQLAEELSPSNEERRRHQATLEVVRALLIKEWPHAKVHLFGSAANGLSVRNSTDIDVCLEILDVEENQGKFVERLGEIFTDAGMDSVKAISHARVPVCKAKCEGISFDVTVNNMLALVNTKMLKDYTDLDPRLRQLVFLVKWWAKRRRVNDSYRGTLSSYAYVLMCINLLQRRDPPILPVLQSLLPSDTSTVTVVSAEQQEISDWAETETGMSAEAVLSTSETLNSGEDKRPGTDRKSSMMMMNSARMSETFEIKEEKGGGTLTELSAAGPPEGSSGCYEQLPSRTTSDAAKKSASSEFLVSRISMGCSPAEVQPGVSTASVYRKQVGPWRCEFYDDIKSMVSFGSGNKECLAELLVAFFDYWAFRHDYPNMAVSIRIPGGLMTKAEKKWTIRQGSERHLVCIEDPFELSHDLGRTIDRDSVGGLRREFERAALVLANEEDPVTLLFQEYL
ncbi:hypothetical protein CEUSTIGMA_g12288.t1 [Chlamydomonas eustigma]|uniref:Uncharacterized protein n=1 Tax=Chlamydomonas eustigma TaxID=1157962 RepID=A0A250XP66_9CHLO|nr:hypothetical protein CEUSTIGMA_g12288.t1 [Chlamydomonas eustigma]|eukprot:GAX84867.1 hypothetical protein CEUSTIGMA_g12288.t1 [Chlamydomonas eustigma]